MKIYKIKVNGKTYKVELEAIEEVKTSSSKEKETVKKAEEIKPIENKPVSTSGEGNDVLAPLQGTIINVVAKVGQHVKKGDTVVIIEAMKLENEVSSPFDGVVSEILVNKGQNVASKQPLLKIK